MTALDHSTSSVLRAGTGHAYRLPADSTVRIANIHGSQVVDTWALAAGGEFLSMEHTRAMLGRLSPRAGDALYSNRRRPVLEIRDDSSPGRHDTLIPACDPGRYRTLGYDGYHRNCHDNFAQACSVLGLDVPMPSPLNLFMNVPVEGDGTLRIESSLARPGDAVTLRALDDLILVLSACPQDLVPINGSRLAPADVAVTITVPQPSPTT